MNRATLSLTAMELTGRFIETIRAEFPTFRIVPKRGHWPSRAIRPGAEGADVGWPAKLSHSLPHRDRQYPVRSPDLEAMSDLDRVVLLRHERVHLRQRRRYGLFLMTLLYLIPFFPLGLPMDGRASNGRRTRETLRATAELFGLEAARSPRLRTHIVQRFTGPEYGWMWPFERSVQAWYDRALENLSQVAE